MLKSIEQVRFKIFIFRLTNIFYDTSDTENS